MTSERESRQWKMVADLMDPGGSPKGTEGTEGEAAPADAPDEGARLRDVERRHLADPQRLFWRDEALGVCPSPGTCFEYGDHVRCGPCAIKVARARGVTPDLSLPGLPEVSRLKRENAMLRQALGLDADPPRA